MNLLRDFYINNLFVSHFGIDANEKNILFVHGGPGLNSQPLISYLEQSTQFDTLKANIFFYDQRSCGKSKLESEINNYQKQIKDLKEIIERLNIEYGLSAIVAHSYGAKLVSDYLKENNCNIPVIMMSTAESINIPRINNIKLDLEYLKSKDSKEYERVSLLAESAPLWEVTESLSETFNKNPNRTKRYWHNYDVMADYLENSRKCEFKMNPEVFVNLRKELYTSDDHNVTIKGEGVYHFIGAHDYIMDGGKFTVSSKTKVFSESAHYPHLEEPEKFCKEINEII